MIASNTYHSVLIFKHGLLFCTNTERKKIWKWQTFGTPGISSFIKMKQKQKKHACSPQSCRNRVDGIWAMPGEAIKARRNSVRFSPHFLFPRSRIKYAVVLVGYQVPRLNWKRWTRHGERNPDIPTRGIMWQQGARPAISVLCICFRPQKTLPTHVQGQG